VISGKSLFEFEQERLLGPLGMRDTAFHVDESKRDRVVEPLPGDRFKGSIAGLGDPVLRRRWQAGGAGMVGTISDYARFAQMLLNGGSLDGRQYLKPETIRLMSSDHVGPETRIGRDQYYFPSGDSGFGLGFAVRTEATPPLPNGEYRWDGVGGTFFFIDPKDDLFAICMMQSPSQRQRIQIELKTLIYQALRK
jgi:CubicO group peptidase (beta-lactamase class C family)